MGWEITPFYLKEIVLYENVFKYFCDLIAKIFFCYFFICDDEAITVITKLLLIHEINVKIIIVPFMLFNIALHAVKTY